MSKTIQRQATRSTPARLSLPGRLGQVLAGLALAGALSCGDGGPGPGTDRGLADRSPPDTATDQVNLIGYYCVPEVRDGSVDCGPVVEMFAEVPACDEGCRPVA